MSEQSFSSRSDQPTCDDCRVAMGPPDKLTPGLDYFGHSVFECEICGKTLVIPSPPDPE